MCPFKGWEISMKIFAYSAVVVAVSMVAWNVPALQAGCGACSPAGVAKSAAPSSQPVKTLAASDPSGTCVKSAVAVAGGDGTCCAKTAKAACHAATQPAGTAAKTAGSCCPYAAKAVAAGDAPASCTKTAGKAKLADAE
jgi:hypothetical protein